MRSAPRRRTVDLGWPALGAVAAGALGVALAVDLAGHGLAAGISAAATWLALWLGALTLRNLVVLLAGRGQPVLLPAQRLPRVWAAWLPLPAFLVGLLFGHFLWP